MSAPDFRPCAIVPSRNHWRAVGGVLAGLRQAGLPVFLVDDGSDEPAASAMAALHDPVDGITLLRLAANQGKGGAVVTAFHAAIAAGYTHAVQVDADGQHDITALPALLDLARRHPQALATGLPVYDASIPTGRAIGRWITHVWVWIETLSLHIRDSMCGFRVYPLAAVEVLLASGERLGARMDFDTEIMVRLFWRGTPVASLPVRVIYPPDNTSNFDLLRDNLRISAMHARLVFAMLWRLPMILAHRPPPLEAPRHWATLSERGTAWGLRLCALAYRLLGRRGCLVMIAPLVLYFYLTGTAQRRASRDFLQRAYAAKGIKQAPGWRDGYRHFLGFAGRALDALTAWSGALPTGTIRPVDIACLQAAAADPRGGLIVVSHIGNVEISRAALDPTMRRRLLILVHTAHAENYNRILGDLNPDYAVNMLQVTELGPAQAIVLKAHVERGDWIVIAGDRVPVAGMRVSLLPFLGKPAPFPQGPYILAALMECPVYALFCQREGQYYGLYAKKLADHVDMPRRDRDAALARHTAAFAAELERHTLADPLQWYNFYDFWAQRGGVSVS